MNGDSRKITNRGGHKIIGYFASRKNGKMIPWESQLERDYIYHLELDPDVLEYVSQPTCINYKAKNGEILKYTPDFGVKRKNIQQYVEVKPLVKTEDPEFQDKMNLVKEQFASEEHDFIVVSEDVIYQQPQFNNLKLLYKYARFPIDEFKKEIVLRYFRNVEGDEIHSALEKLSDENIGIDTLFQLIASDDLQIDMSKPIDAVSWVASKK